jgi:tetratricopeptide (TPR) repeat protein
VCRFDLVGRRVARASGLTLRGVPSAPAAEHYAEMPAVLNERSRTIARQRGKAATEYPLARRWAEAACRLRPQDGSLLATLGMAQYRVGDYQQAVDILTRAGQLNADSPAGPAPADLAFLAMALYRLDKRREAEATLQRLREVVHSPQWVKQEEALGFLREAEEVAAGQAAGANH